MAHPIKAHYARTDKRQAKREQEEIQRQWDRVRKEFEAIVFNDDFNEEAFQAFSEQWIKWAEAWNNKPVITLANPRMFHDYAINQEIFE